MKELDFAALLCSRLCHDLISPVGAISNGIEILSTEEDEEMRVEVMKLIEHSASQTSNRLKFYRLAFGAAGGVASRVPIRDVHSAAVSLFEGTSINLEWNSEVGEVSKSIVKLILNLVLIASESLIRGGDLTMNLKESGDKINVTVSVTAERYILQDKVLKVLCGESTNAEGDPKIAPAYLAANVAEELNSKIEYAPKSDSSFALKVNI